MNKQEALAMSQREANRTDKHMLVLNLNPFGSMWVVREYENRLAKERGVWIVPNRIHAPHRGRTSVSAQLRLTL